MFYYFNTGSLVGNSHNEKDNIYVLSNALDDFLILFFRDDDVMLMVISFLAKV